MVGEAKCRPSVAAEDEPNGDPEARAAGAALTSSGQGICAEIGALPAGALVTERGLAALLGKATRSVRRAVGRGELPPPIRMLGEPRWTVGTILRHIDKRLENAAREAEQERRRFEGNSP
jgi:hypothetical protein